MAIKLGVEATQIASKYKMFCVVITLPIQYFLLFLASLATHVFIALLHKFLGLARKMFGFFDRSIGRRVLKLNIVVLNDQASSGLSDYFKSQEKLETMRMQNLGGQTESIMAFSKVAYTVIL